MNSSALPPIRIVAVHGVGNSFGAEVSDLRRAELRKLKGDVWTQHLSKGLGISPERISLDFAYYADKLVPGPVSQGTADSDQLDDPLAQEMLAFWAREIGVPRDVSQGHATVPLRALCTWVAHRFDLAEGPLRVFVRMFFSEVAIYLRAEKAPERLHAREEVAACISRHQPHIVIAHSLGSVVAYEALHAHPEPQPELFLTLGSPLALPKVVFERLTPAPQPGRAGLRGACPAGEVPWVNIADLGDPVAVPPRLSRFFDGINPDQDHTTVISHLFRFHHATNYLESPTTAAVLAPYFAT